MPGAPAGGVTFSPAGESNQRARLGDGFRMEQAQKAGQLHSQPPPKNPLLRGTPYTAG